MTAAFAFILVLCRCGACVALLPALGESDLPPLVRVGVAGSLAALLTPVLAASLPPMPATLPPLVTMLCAELLAGAALGWLARVIVLALPSAGQIISLMTGLSSIVQPDPELGASTAVLGRLLGLAAPVLILATGLYALPITALGRSYAVFPPGTFPAIPDLAQAAAHAATASFALALQLAAPFVVAGTVWQVALGLLARLVPQLQVYVAALPGQVLGGLILLAALGTGLLAVWQDAVRSAFAALP